MIHDTNANFSSYFASVKGGKSAMERILMGWTLTSSVIHDGDKTTWSVSLPSETDLVYRSENGEGDDGEASDFSVLRFEILP
jgi:hypothetical protein